MSTANVSHVGGFFQNKKGHVFPNEIVTRDHGIYQWSEVVRQHMERTRTVPSEIRRGYRRKGLHVARRAFREFDMNFEYPAGRRQRRAILERMVDDFVQEESEKLLTAHGYGPARRSYFYDVAALPDDWDELPLDEQRKFALAPSGPKEPSVNTLSERKSMFIRASDLILSASAPKYIIKPLIEENTTCLCFGESGIGKTFIVTSLGLAVCTGTPWAGHQAERGLVVYFLGEGAGGFPRRLAAGSEHMGISAEALSNFHVSRSLIDLKDASEIVREISSLAGEDGLPVKMIVIDTLARHIDGDESSNLDMGRFVAAVERVRSAFPGSCAMIVHHPGHGDKKRSRGAYCLKGALEHEIRVDPGKIVFLKNKDGKLPEPILFKLVPVEIGRDEDGEPITSCGVTFGETSEHHQDEGFTVKERVAIRALIDASAKSGEPVKGKIGATLEDWRQAFYLLERESVHGAKQGTLRQSFNRATEALSGKGVVLEDSVFRVLADPRHQDEILTQQTFKDL